MKSVANKPRLMVRLLHDVVDETEGEAQIIPRLLQTGERRLVAGDIVTRLESQRSGEALCLGAHGGVAGEASVVAGRRRVVIGAHTDTTAHERTEEPVASHRLDHVRLGASVELPDVGVLRADHGDVRVVAAPETPEG